MRWIAGPVGRAVLCWDHSTDPRYHGDLGADRVERGVDTGRILSRALRQVRLTATAAFDRHRKLFDQVVGTDSEVLGSGIGRDRIRHSLAFALGNQRHHRRLATQLAADVADQRPQVCRGHPAGHSLRHQTDVTDPLSPGGGIGGGCPGAGHPDTFEFLLGGPQALH